MPLAAGDSSSIPPPSKLQRSPDAGPESDKLELHNEFEQRMHVLNVEDFEPSYVVRNVREKTQ